MNQERYTNTIETLSTDSFYKELSNIDFRENGPRIRTFSVDLEPRRLVELVSANTKFTMIESSDGVISHVKETLHANPLDNSKSSGYFVLHTDGNYLEKVPEIVILHCIDPGKSEMPTVFLDTEELLNLLKVENKLDEAKEYQFVFKNKKGIEYRRPLVEEHSITGELLMNIAIASAQCHLEASLESTKTQIDADRFYELLGTLVEKKLTRIPFYWKKNDVVVFDNLKLIHGRGLPEQNHTEFVDTERHLCRMWLDYNDEK